MCANNVSDLFGCVGVNSNKGYCVLNKQYAKEEYEELVPRIIEHMKKTGEWGKPLPPEVSPFGYNDTSAQDFFPTTREQALADGFPWTDYVAPFPKVSKTIPGSMLP